MTDERQGKPSASGVERLQLCPGSWNAERGLPPLPESEDAASGTRIHEVLAGNGTVMLGDDEADVVNRCSDLQDKAVEQVFGSRDKIIEKWTEERLWFGGSVGYRFSGKADYVAISDTVGLILDYKTGRNEVATADGNLQLRAIAVLLQANSTPYDRIVVGIIAPWQSNPISLCEYSPEDLSKAREWLIGVLDAADKPDAPRIPSEKACRYCRARGVCKEAQTMALSVAEPMDELLHSGMVIEDVPARMLGRFLDKARFAESVITACRDEAKRRLKAGEEVPGWQLKDGATKEVIKDLETIHQRFIGYGGTTAQYLACLSAAKGKLQDAMKEVTGYKGKELKAAFEALIQDCVEVKQNEPSLERVKGEKAING